MSKQKSTFSRKKRTMEVGELKFSEIAAIPAPNHYKNTIMKDKDNALYFNKAPRKTGFEAPRFSNPGPGDYGSKRMFDNKTVVDYSVRLKGF